MPQNPEDQKKEEDSFIREYIKSKPLNRRNLVIAVLTAILLGVLLGGTAAITYRLGTSDLSGGAASADAGLTDTSETQAQEAQEQDTDTQEASDTETIIMEQELEISDYQKLKYELYSIGRSVGESIVTVSATSQGTDLFQSDYESTDQTMGLVLSADENAVLILTQYEPLSDAVGIQVAFSDSDVQSASIVGYDASTGLAVISVDADALSDSSISSIEAAVLKTTGVLPQGQIVIAVGSPQGIVDTILDGTITSNTNEISIDDGVYTIYTTSMLGTEDGSGVLVNVNGEVIGIMMMEYSTESSSNTLSAVSVKELYPVIEKLMNGEEIAYMGVKISTVTTSMAEKYGLPAGVYVREAADDSPAFDAGIQAGDIITMIGDTQISSASDFMDYMLQCRPDQTVSVTVMRASGEDYAEVTCSVKLSRK